MNKIIYFFIVLVYYVSCSNETNKSYKKSQGFERATSEAYFNYTENTYEALSLQKLKDYFDLIKLKNKYPNFKNDIFLQLQSLSKDSILEGYEGNFLVENIGQIGDSEKISDSTYKIKLKYQVVLETHRFTDSIYAIITSKHIQLDGNEFLSNKVIFSKN